MNFGAIEDSFLEEKKKFSNFFSRFLKNSRVLIILLTALIITAVSFSIWLRSPEYQTVYNNLSNEDGEAIIEELKQMQVPYQFSEISGQISVPKDKLYEVRLHLAERNLPRDGGVGFELLDKEKLGISQFNEQINYHRALEGELARTIQRIKIIKNARVHIAFPKSSLFLEDKKKPSASVVLEIYPGRTLDTGQINAILHLVSSSISNLSVENITVIDQSGKLLNQPSLGYDQNNNLQFKYSEDVESRYISRIKNILEPLVGIGNVYAQVTAQIDFNAQEKTQEKYAPNSNYKNQAIRSHQTSVHDQITDKSTKKDVPNSLSNSNIYFNQKITNNNNTKKNDLFKHNSSLNTNINRDNIINYELNHSVSHIKMNIGEIKRLSAAVIVNFTKDKNGKYVPLSSEKIKDIEHLVREAIGYSKYRGDTIRVVNTSFAQLNRNIPVQLNNSSTFKTSQFLLISTPWFLSFLFLAILLKKYICPFSKKNILKNKPINTERKYEEKQIKENSNLIKNIDRVNIQENTNIDDLINKIQNISSKNPRTIALIIRQWMSDKT